MAATTEPAVLYQQQQTVTANGSIVLDVTPYTEVDIFLWVNSFTGGTSPSLTLTIDALDPFGNTYTYTNFSNIAAGAGSNTSVGVGALTNHPLGTNLQIFWTLNGAPTNATFSLFVVGK